MSGTSRKVPDNVAEILKEFKTQCSATRQMVGVGNRNFFMLGQPGTTLDDETIHVPPTQLKFDSFESNQPDSTETENAYLSMPSTSTNAGRPLGVSIKRPMDGTPAGLHAKRLAPSPGGIDWSPASKEQRNRLLETVDSRINDLQKLVSKNHDFKQELMKVMDSEKLALQRQKEKDQQTIKLLQQQVQATKDELFDVEQNLIKKKTQLRELRLQTDQELQTLESDKSDLEDRLQQVQGELSSVQAELSLELEYCQGQLVVANSLTAQQAERLEALETEVVELRQRQIREEALQEKLEVAEARVRELQAEVTSARASSQQREAPTPLSATSRRVRELEEQLGQNRELLRGKLLLDETTASLRAQLATSSKAAEQLATLQELNKRKEAELKEWHSLACQLVSDGGGGDCGVSPRAVSARVQQLEQSQLVLKADLSEALSQLSGAKQARSGAEAELRAEQGRRQALQASADLQASTVRKLERKLQLITKERDSIQSVLVAYEGDLTMAGGQLQQLQRARTESAERSAAEMRAMVASLESELAQARGGTGDPRGELALLHDKFQASQLELEKEKARAASMEERANRLELLLEQRALRGDYDPSQTKVLHFRMNPSAQEEEKRNEEVARLRASNDKLRERVRVLESAEKNGSALLNTTAVVEEHLKIQSNKELTELREKVKQLEKKSERLVEYFKKTSSEYRHAVYVLFGFKMDVISENNFRLTSMFAEREEDNLHFKIEEKEDTVNMVQTSFSDSIPELIKTHLDEQNSFPAFMSALTLDLFSRQTFTS